MWQKSMPDTFAFNIQRPNRRYIQNIDEPDKLNDCNCFIQWQFNFSTIAKQKCLNYKKKQSVENQAHAKKLGENDKKNVNFERYNKSVKSIKNACMWLIQRVTEIHLENKWKIDVNTENEK